MSRYFVTGGQGFVGRYLVAHLLDTDRAADILAVGRSAHNDRVFTHVVHWGGRTLLAPVPSPLRLLHRQSVQYRYESVDIRDRPGIRSLLTDFAPDVVFHLASGLRDDPPEHLFRTNVEGTICLLEALAESEKSVQKLILGSSGSVYGAPTVRTIPVIGEDEPCVPLDLYAVSKLASEYASRILTRRYAIPAVWARMFNLVGPGQDERHVCGRFAAQIAAIALDELPPFIDVGDLSPTRDFIDVRDAASALLTLATHGRPGDVYNVASGRETPIEQILMSTLRLAGLEGRVEIRRDTYHRPADIPRYAGSVTRLEGLGARRQYELEHSLRDVLFYYQSDVSKAAGAME